MRPSDPCGSVQLKNLGSRPASATLYGLAANRYRWLGTQAAHIRRDSIGSAVSAINSSRLDGAVHGAPCRGGRCVFPAGGRQSIVAKHVLLIAEARIATVQILELILHHLGQTTTLSVSSKLLSELEPEDFTDDTYPLLVRSCSPEASSLVRALSSTGAPFGFYLDDNFWLLDPTTPLGRHYAAKPTRRRLDSIVREATPVIASTPLLRDFLRPRARDVQQLDSFFDFALVPQVLPPRSSHARLRVGFAASASRGDDLATVLADVCAALEEHPQLEFEVIGADPEALPDHDRIIAFDYLASYAEYVAFQRTREWDIGIAPLGGATSNRYKTDNKYREYAALGIAGIYQESEPYSAVRDGVTGLIVGRDRGWREAIDRYCAEPGLIDAVRAAARQDVEERLSLDVVAPQWGKFFSAAPAIGDRPGRADAVRRALAPPSTPRALRAQRRGLLWAYGRTHLAERGFWFTLVRTVRYPFRRRREKPFSLLR